jgi:hypothetical protein
VSISLIYIFCYFSSSTNREFQQFHISVAPGAILGGTQLIHLGHTLLELLVLAFLVRVALIL